MNRTVFAAVLLLWTPAVSTAEDEEFSVCRIESTFADGEKNELTGFKVKGKSGIYTALHGVLGTQEITGFLHDPKTRRVPLEMTQVDIDRDVAFLVPADATTALPQGLALGVWPLAEQFEATLAGKPATVIGHPLGIDLKPSHSSLVLRSKRPVARLTDLLNPVAREELKKRGSPSTGVMMLSLEGPFLPGHSGAPILDQDGAVIGIGNGGLKEGQVGQGWATPFHDVQLEPADDPTVVDRLKLIPPLRSNRSLFLVVDADVRKQRELLAQIATTVETDDGRPVQAFKTPAPVQGGGSSTAAAGGKPQLSALEQFLMGRVFLYSGTAVKINSEPELITNYLPGESLPLGLDGLFVRVQVTRKDDPEASQPELLVPLSTIRQRGDKPSVSIVNTGIMVAGDVNGMVAGRDIIIINPQRPVVKKLVLNNDGIATLVLKESTQDLLFGAQDEASHVGFAIVGTEVKLLEGRKAPIPVLVFRMVEILSGELKGKRGWVSQSAIHEVESN